MLYEPFNDAGGTALTATGRWVAYSAAGTNPATVLSTAGDAGSGNSLGFAGLPASSGRRVALNGLGTNGEDVQSSPTFSISTAVATTETLYLSFLLKVTALPSGSPPPFIGLNDATVGTYARVHINPNGSNFDLRLSGTNPPTGTGASTPTLLNLNQTYYIVVKVTLIPGSPNDIARLYINPDPTLPEPASPYVSSTFLSEPSVFQRVFLVQSTSFGTYEVDEIRVTRSWVELPVELSSFELN